MLQETSRMATLSPSAAPAPAMLAATAAAVFFVVALMIALYRGNNKLVTMTTSKDGPPPGPRGLPVLGNMHQMVANKPAVSRWLHRLLAESGGGDLVCVRLGPVHVVAVSCPAMAREVLRRNDAVFADRPATFAAAAFSKGYRSASIAPAGDQWRKMRRVLTA